LHPGRTSSRADTHAALQANLAPLFAQALAARAFSAASVLVAAGESVIFEACHGTLSFAPDAPPVTTAAWFDLASLTKPLVTAVLTVLAIDRCGLHLDDPLTRFLDNTQLPSDKRPITLRHLLNHCSGLPAYRTYYHDLIARPPEERRLALLSWILSEPLVTAPGSHALYSDVGFMLLGEIVSRVFAMELDRAAAEALFSPLDLVDLGFHRIEPGTDPTVPPRLVNGTDLPACASTEMCPWRRRLLAGEVHDENAYALGGVAGHAGLFGSARGIFRLIGFLWGLYKGAGAHADGLTRLLRTFWRRQDLVPGSTWALGFDTPSPTRSSSGDAFAPLSVGHLGFTGTSFWLDLERQLLVVLLTNRVHPNRDNLQIQAFRPLLHNRIVETLHAVSRH
jgi:CubicO group peptidase (beta-lactamase class C family)